MRVIFHLTYVLGLVFIIGETARRGVGYFAINATTMIEDYSCGVLMLTAAWGYATGGLLVPFFAHFEAWLRGATFRPDHPHDDLKAIVIKGILWAICVVCLTICVRRNRSQAASGAAA